MMKVLVADQFEEIGLEGLKSLGVQVEYEPDLKGDSLTEKIKNSEINVLVVRSTQVNASMIDVPTLSLIIRAGAGYNTIDVEAASHKNVCVANCPGKNSQAVAELTMGLMIAVDRKIPSNVLSLQKGKWNKKEFSKSRGLYGRTLGIVGFGKIAQEVILRAKAFGMKILINSRWITQEMAQELNIQIVPNIEDLAKLSDIVSLHTSLTPKTKNIINDSFFKAMKPGSIFINTSRAELIAEGALERALEKGEIFAGVDVLPDEPSSGIAEYNGPFRNLQNLYCTHHIGASTEQAQTAIAEEVVHIVKDYVQSGHVRNLVNLQSGART